MTSARSPTAPRKARRRPRARGAARVDGFDELRLALRRFVDDRGWERYHDPKSLSMALACEAAEVMEELRWVSTRAADTHSAHPERRARLTDELGDVGMCLIMLADRLGIDLRDAIAAKIEKSAAKYPPARSSPGRG